MQNEIKALHFEGKENHLQLNEKLDQLSIAIQRTARPTRVIEPRSGIEELNEKLDQLAIDIPGTTKTTAVVEPRTGIGGPEEVLSNDDTAKNSTIAHTNHDFGALGKNM
jgi:hypothetical protein